MTGRIMAFAAACSCWAAAQGPVDPELFLLTRAVRLETASIRLAGQKRPDSLKHAQAALSSGQPETARLSLLRSLAELRGIQWTGAHAAASACAFLAGETVVEPGAQLHAAVELYRPSAAPPPNVLTASIVIRRKDGKAAAELAPQEVLALIDREVHLRAPAEGDYYTLALELKDAGTGQPVASSRKSLWVVANLRARLRHLQTRAEALALKADGPVSAAWINTVLAIVERYSTAREQSFRTASQMASPLAQTLAIAPESEPLDPPSDLAWAERALDSLAAGRQVPEAGIWMPLAVRSRQDQTLRLARIWWPPETPKGLVLLLGGTLAHDRSWIDIQPGNLLALAPAQRAIGSGWGGPAWEDIEDWLVAIRLLFGARQQPLYVLMHGAGAAEGMNQARKTPSRFAGVALVAGQSQQPLQSVPKDFPPLMLVEAGKDAFVQPDAVRRAGLLLQRRLRTFEYAVFADADYDAVRALSAPRAFAFFAALAAGTWKPSGKPVPLPGDRSQ